MKTKKSWISLGSIITIVILIGCTLFLYNRYIKSGIFGLEDQSENKTETSTETGYQLDATYPRYLIEGTITSVKIDLLKGEFKVEINVNKIFLNELSFTREVTVLTDEETEFVLYELEIEKETPIKIEDFEIGSPVVISTKELNNDILTQNIFTGTKMIKMLSTSKNI